MIIPSNAKRIIEILQHNSHDAYVVGGCVRDTLMGAVPGDWDITTSARPEEVKKLFRRTIDTGIEHGTVTVLMRADRPGARGGGACVKTDELSRTVSDLKTESRGGDVYVKTGEPSRTVSDLESYEVTTYRIDGDYSDHRRPDKVEFSDSLHEDLRRRDFTINAMAYNDEQGLVDEFGGQKDLEDKVIRCVGNADERLEEDALRMLRAIRFSAKLGFRIEEETLEAIKKHAPELQHVSAERINTELYKTLISEDPYKLQLLWDLGLAAFISPGFTRISSAAGTLAAGRAENVPTPADPGCDTVSCQETAAAAPDRNNTNDPVRLKYAPWAGLMRCISPDDARTILKELKSDNDTIRSTCLLVAEYKLALPQSPYEIKKCLNRIGPELFEDLMELKRDSCDDGMIGAVRRLSREIIGNNEPYRISDLDIDGHAVMALGYKGREVGQTLEYLLDKVTEDPQLNERETLERLAAQKERKDDE